MPVNLINPSKTMIAPSAANFHVKFTVPSVVMSFHIEKERRPRLQSKRTGRRAPKVRILRLGVGGQILVPTRIGDRNEPLHANSLAVRTKLRAWLGYQAIGTEPPRLNAASLKPASAERLAFQ